ncbi:hypothetical protein ACJX0J_037081, partial [Zea mays]
FSSILEEKQTSQQNGVVKIIAKLHQSPETGSLLPMLNLHHFILKKKITLLVSNQIKCAST